MSTKIIKPVKYGDQIEIEITSLAFGGDSVGRFQDFALFVPGGLPGERVRLKVTQVKDHYATGEILSILRPSPDRVTPNCGIFEECGGCQWQHLSYPRQLQTKRQFVVDSLKRIGKLDNVTVQPCLPSPAAYAYRNKAMPVLSMRDGHFVTGIYEPRSHHLVPYHSCPIQADEINDLLQKVLQKIERSGLTPYQEKKHEGFLRHLTVRRGLKTGEALLAFVTRTETPEERVQKPTLLPESFEEILPRIARELMAEVPGLAGVLQNINPSRTNIVFGPTTKLLAGRDHYYEEIDGLRLKVSLKSFLQVNTAQADILHALVREALGEPKHKKQWGTVLDLYSGIGTLAMAVSQNADYVVGVEEVGAAVDDARFNADLNRRANIDYLEGDVPQILLGLKEKGLAQIDAAIMDPPRKGVLPEVLARLAAFYPERLVYVSCDPATLARDLALLAKHGYAVDWAQPLDMFPQTYHVETVVRLTRTTPLPPEVMNQEGRAELEPFRLPKPVEPASLNIAANFNALKEKTADLLKAGAGQASAASALAGSVARAVFGGMGRSLQSLGKGAGSIFKGRPKIQSGSLEERLLSQIHSAPAAPRAMEPEVPVWPSMEETASLTQEQVERVRPEPAATENPVNPVLASQTGATEAETADPMEASIEEIEEGLAIPSVEPPVEAPTVSYSETTLSQSIPPASVLSQEEIREIEGPAQVEEKAEEIRPVLESVPETPVILPPVLSTPVAEPPKAPLETPVQEQAIAEPSHEEVHRAFLEPLPPAAPPAETPVLRPQHRPWTFPRPRFNFQPLLHWFHGQKGLRYALIAAFLACGVLIAKATLSPESKKFGAMSPTVAQMIPDVIAVMPTRNFLRYELVPFEVTINHEEIGSFPDMHATVEVFQDGKPVTLVDGRTKLSLKKDVPHGKFIGNWPIPYNPPVGTYVAEVVVTSPTWETAKDFESAFTIPPLRPNGMPAGYAALTMEGGKRLIGGAVPALDGSDSLRAANALDWAKFMGADTYCFLMAQTSAWDHFSPRDFPFNRGDMEVGRKYAKAAHAVGLKFGAYMTTFKVMGDAWNQVPYQFALGYDPDSDEVVQDRFISVEDPKRRQDVIGFLKEMDQDPNVDMVGLDYIRTGDAGYEMVDEFVNDMNVPGPDNFWSLSKEERIHWLAKTVETGRKKDSPVVALFDWWRAHKVATIVRGILEEAKISKPVFTFTLGWKMGHEHGQDPAMLIDAGIGYNQIMLYQSDRSTLASMKTQWPEYLARGNGMFAPGEMVDFNWVQKSVDPPGPQELYNREVDILHQWFPVNAQIGMFWHDLYRIVYGVKGPYSAMEWTVAGGKAFTMLRQTEGLSPLEVTLTAPKKVPGGVSVPLQVEIRNPTPQDLKGVVLHQIDASKDYYADLATVGPFDLPAGDTLRVKSLYVNIPKENQPDRDNRFMAAVVAEKPGQSWRVFDFAYMKKSSGASVRDLENDKGNGSDPKENDDQE